jgi:hypothetical protein
MSSLGSSPLWGYGFPPFCSGERDNVLVICVSHFPSFFLSFFHSFFLSDFFFSFIHNLFLFPFRDDQDRSWLNAGRPNTYWLTVNKFYCYFVYFIPNLHDVSNFSGFKCFSMHLTFFYCFSPIIYSCSYSYCCLAGLLQPSGDAHSHEAGSS